MSRPNRGPYLKPNAAGIEEIHWTENGRSKRRSTGCTNNDDAQVVLAQFILLKARKDKEKSPGVEIPPMTVAEALGDPEAKEGDDYWHEHVVPTVIGKDTQKFAINKLLQHYGPIYIRDLKPSDTLDYIEKRTEGDLGQPSVNSTIARELGVLSAGINHAAAHRKSRLALHEDQELPVISKPIADGPRDRWLRLAEAEAALAVARARDDKRLARIFVFMMLALHTAARSTAIRQLTWFQVDIDRRLITYNPTGRAQTNKRRPPVAISDTLYSVLAQAHKEKTNGHVLGHPGSVRTAFKSVIEDAGLHPAQPWLEERREPTEAEWRLFWQARVTPHTFRHTWATWAAQRGESMFAIAGVLGDTLKTVEKNYAHHHPDFQKDTMNSTPKVGAL